MAALKKALSNRPFAGAVLFVVFLFVFEELHFDFPQTKFLQLGMMFFSPYARLILIASSIGSLVLSYSFVLIALKSSIGFRITFALILILALLIQYGYWQAVQRFVSPADLRIAAATPLNTWTGAGVLYFDWRFSLPALVFVILLFLFNQRQQTKSSVIQLISVLLCMVLLNVFYTFSNQTINLGLSLSSFYQTITQSAIQWVLPAKRETLNYQSSGVPQNNILLVIDESIRGDHLSINGYARETTPFLARLMVAEPDFHNFGLAVAHATCSYPSNALILTGVRPGVDPFEKTINYPTIFQYAKAMGYKTYYLDVQTNSLWNGLTDHDLSYIDSWERAREFGSDCESDFRAADRIARIFSEGTGNFVLLNKAGVHFLYESSYPSHAAIWQPLPHNYAEQPGLVSNSYDNGIRYNVNTFFERLLINPGILEHTAILYTSDHGQTLFENQASWLHCNHTPEEATVPLILIGRNLPPVNEGYYASHGNILPTLLDLMSVPATERQHAYAPSLFAETGNERPDYFYFDGSLRLIDFPDP